MASVAALTALLGGLLAVPTPLRLTADVDDVYALKANPAALGHLDGFQLRLVYGRADADLYAPAARGTTDGFGVFTAIPLWEHFVLGASVEADVDGVAEKTATKYAVGLGWSAGRVAFGLSYENLPAFGGDTKGMVDFGVSLRLASFLALGLNIQDLAQHAMRRQWDVGLALRPHERLTLSSRWRVTQDEPLNEDTLDLAFLASAEPIDGLHLGVGTDLDLTLFFSLGLDFGGIGVGTAINGVRGDPSFVAELVYDAADEPSLVEPSAVAVLELAGELAPESEFTLLDGQVVYPYGDVPLMLDALRESDRVKGVFARIGSLDVGWAKATETRRALVRLKDSGRRVDCQLFGRGDIVYYLASACTSVIITPPQMLEMNGLAAEVLFFGEALDRLGVRVDVVRRGAYKNSPDQFARSGMSVAHREALGAYLDTVFEALVDGIAEGRGIEKDEVLALIDRGTFTSSEAVALNLVDERLYPDEVEDHIREHYGGAARFARADTLLPATRPRWAGRSGIAIIHVDAAITGGESRDLPLGLGQTVGARTLIGAIESARLRSDVRAVVLRVDSPGGDAVASDLVARAIRKLAEEKPVIASFGDIAASGGYYVAADASTIYAEPTTLTGSIGVFSVAFAFEDLLARLGVHTSVVERGANANAGSAYTNPSPEALAMIRKSVDDAYEMFLDVVARGRKLDKEKIRELAEGRIWSGRDAKARGLVDELGGLTDAVRAAKLAAGFDEDDPIDLLTLPDTRAPLPEPVRTIVGVFTPEDPTVIRELLPPALRQAVGTWLAPFGDGRAHALTLAPWRIRIR